jgi:putative ABC transport system permease protein
MVKEFLTRLRFLFSRRKHGQLNDEFQFHLERSIAANIAAGMSADEARRRAMIAFGGVERAREQCHEQRPGWWLGTVAQDVRYGLRLLVKSPGFAAITVLTMALGVGATTAIFSVVDATLLHPLSYPQPQQLVRIEDDLPGAGAQDVGISIPEWKDFERAGIFDYVSVLGGGSVNLTGTAQPARIALLTVTPNYLALIGVRPQLGRWFDPADQTPGFNLEVVISDGLWKRAFGADPNILGRSLRLDNDVYHVIGVMPPGFHDPEKTTERRNTDVWAAAGFTGAPAPPPQRGLRVLPDAVGRLKPGLTIAAAQSQMDALVASLQKQFPADYPAESGWRVRLVPLKESVVGNVREPLMLLLGAVGLVLLIGYVNVANLLLARASARGREIAVRQALGAARPRLIRQLLTESIVLSLLGGLTGVGILFITKGFLLRMVPESLPRLNDISISWVVLLFALGVSAAAGMLFGLAPALQAGRLDLARTLKGEGRGTTGTGEQARTRRVLVVTEFALSLVLMIAAGLLLRSFWDLLNARLGFDPQNVMAVRIWLPVPNDPSTDIYGNEAKEAPFIREVLRRVGTLPGVNGAAIGSVDSIPLNHDRNLLPMTVEGRDVRSNVPSLVEGSSSVTPEYFQLLSVPLLHGRLFSNLDNENAPPVAVVNEAFARTYWPDGNVLGKRVKFGRNGTNWTTIVGVVADARTETLEQADVPQVYRSMYQRRDKELAVFLRGQLDPAAIPEEVRAQVQSINPELPVFGAAPLPQVVSDSLSQRRFSMEMVLLFALAALLLAGLGIYGTISYLVSERTHEIGIRLALGAKREKILRMILRQGLELAIAGAAVGLAGALILSHLMAGLLYGVSPTDPRTFIGVTLVLTVVALAACYIPAMRAMRVDPLVALRYE